MVTEDEKKEIIAQYLKGVQDGTIKVPLPKPSIASQLLSVQPLPRGAIGWYNPLPEWCVCIKEEW